MPVVSLLLMVDGCLVVKYMIVSVLLVVIVAVASVTIDIAFELKLNA